MRPALLLLLVACGGKDDPGPTDPGTTPTGTVSGSTVTPPTTTGQPAYAEPAEAEDLDADPAVLHVALSAAPHTYVTGGIEVEGYAYNGQVPGPTLRARVGDTLIVDLSNGLDDPTTIHWHGAQVPWEMDGVTWMSTPVQPGGSFRYEFTLTHGGTFWYHPHFDTMHQVDLGLYGALIVEDPADPVADLDAIWFLDSAGEADEDTGLGTGHLVDPTVRDWTINGLRYPLWTLAPNDRARVRLINVSNGGYLNIEGLRVIGGEHGLTPIEDDVDLVLGPGERAEIEVFGGGQTTTVTLPWSAAGGPAWGDEIPLVDVTSAGAVGGQADVHWPRNPVLPTEDPGTTAVSYTLQGDGSDGWMINGELFPDVTVAAIPVGADSVIEVRNLSTSEHPFHVHGMRFEVLSIDGVPPVWRTFDDTINVRIGQRVRLLVHPENAGDWMVHCHILPHADGGMMTVLRAE